MVTLALCACGGNAASNAATSAGSAAPEETKAAQEVTTPAEAASAEEASNPEPTTEYDPIEYPINVYGQECIAPAHSICIGPRYWFAATGASVCDSSYFVWAAASPARYPDTMANVIPAPPGPYSSDTKPVT